MKSNIPTFNLLLLHPRYWLTWFGLFVLFLISKLPISWQDRMAARAGMLLMKHNSKRYQIVEKNMSLSFPGMSTDELNTNIAGYFQLLTISLMHYGLFWWSSDRRIDQMIDTQGFELVKQSRDKGKNVIILLSHCSGLEFAVYAICRDFLSAGTYKSFPNPVIDRLIYRARVRDTGLQAFDRDEGFRPVIKNAKQGRVIIYLADEDLGADNSEFVDFFGIQKATIPVLGRLAKACNADVLPAMACYDRQMNKYTIKLFEADSDFPCGDQLADTQAMNRMIEQTVNYCPLQYFWAMKIFKTRPEGEKGFY